MIEVDPVQAALIAGGTLVAKDIASAAIKDAYQGLKSRIKSKFGDHSQADLILDSLDTKPEVWTEPLRDLLEGSEALRDPSIIQAARELLEMIGPSQIAIGDQNVQVAGDVGIIVQGDYVGSGAEKPHDFGVSASSPAPNLTAKFRNICDLMPELLAEMKDDLTTDDTQLIKEIYVLFSSGQGFNGDRARFVYFKNEHADLLNKLDFLRDCGFVDDVTEGSTPIYRMTEEFIQFLRQADLPSK